MANDDALSRLADALGNLRRLEQDRSLERFQEPMVLPSAPSTEDAESTKKASVTPRDANEEVMRLVESLEQTRNVQQEQIRSLMQNTNAILQAGTAKESSGESIPAKAAKSAVDTMKGNFFLSPLLGGILNLFGGGKAEAPAPLPMYSLPPSVRLEAGYSANSDAPSLRAIDQGADGLPRVAQPAHPTPQITVQVQAFDSRSFLDHSEEIARAVRHAVLNSHALNDVVSEL